MRLRHLWLQPALGIAGSADHSAWVIQSFRHKGLQRYFEHGSLGGIQPHHAKRLRVLLAALETATVIQDMDMQGFRLHSLKGSLTGRWSVWISASWRLTFEFFEGDAFKVDYEDYH